MDPKHQPQLQLERDRSGSLRLRMSGSWNASARFPGFRALTEVLDGGPPPSRVVLDASGVERWDSRFVAAVARIQDLCRQRRVPVDDSALPDGARRLLRLASAVPEASDVRGGGSPKPFLARLGAGTVQAWEESLNLFTFLGEVLIALGRLFRGKAQFRMSDLLLVIQQTGPGALGIVALINFLVGLILAFVGATTLQQFGATIFVADTVAIGTVREMGAIMTAVILCGRTGAAFAAQLGTMKVNEEIAALRTFGISPVEFLVLPRIIALVLMMPLLVVFADLISILGGLLVSSSVMDVSSTVYIDRTIQAIKLKSFLLGVSKGGIFGFLVAYTGCLRGIQCGSNAAAVGEATTRAVVAGITSIIVFDGVFAVLCNALKI
jgi:phospholipid/cholesterol/gamma-HCH transport system permease protein